MARHLFLFTVLFACFCQIAYATSSLERVEFAAGCFWCAEHDFEQVQGVISVVSGYTGGKEKNPTYEMVSSGATGHYEAIQVTYNPSVISYKELLNVFWHNVDPTDADGQFCDRGKQYRAAIFYHNQEEKKLAEASKAELLRSGHFKQIAVAILPSSTFYPAESYHQNYSTRNPVRYRYYRYRCGRDQRLREVWGIG